MSELLLEADCHISKAGASTVFEAQAAAKPLIITDYVHGQELETSAMSCKRDAAALSEKVPTYCRRFTILRKHLKRVAEDAGFYQHEGIDLPDIARAALKNF